MEVTNPHIFKAFFFDMDGVVFNSMPRHAKAWEVVMSKYGLPFTAYDCYLQEGRTGQSVIDECFLKTYGRHAKEEEWKAIYREKSNMFYEQGPAELIPGIKDLLFWLQSNPSQPQIFLVTGSGQRTLLDELDSVLPGIFARERMVTAFDYRHGKPDPEPYLMAYEKALRNMLNHPPRPTILTIPLTSYILHLTSSIPLAKEDCCVVENAPLGVQSGKAAGLFVVGVNTGILKEQDLYDAGADIVFPDMPALHAWLKNSPL